MNTKIIGTGSAVPSRVLDNAELSTFLDTSDEWIRTRTGIRSRHIAQEGQTASALAAQAAKKAIADAGIAAEQIEAIIVATSTPDYIFPSTANLVQQEIGAERAACFDLSAACTGFLYAMSVADAYIKVGMYKKVLVIGAEVMSQVVDWKDRSVCVLFGDGAGAAVLRAEKPVSQAVGSDAVQEKQVEAGMVIRAKADLEPQNPARAEKSGIFAMKMGSDGKKGPVLSCVSRTIGNFLTNTEPQIGYMTMDGQEVFKFAVKKVPETIKELLDENGLEPKDVKHYVLHQANYRIAEAIAKRLKVSMEQIPTNMEHYGNTSGASIPLLLDELNRAGKIQKGDLLVLAGFGAGLTWGATLVRW